jgi:hypothetical protein
MAAFRGRRARRWKGHSHVVAPDRESCPFRKGQDMSPSLISILLLLALIVHQRSYQKV